MTVSRWMPEGYAMLSEALADLWSTDSLAGYPEPILCAAVALAPAVAACRNL